MQDCLMGMVECFICFGTFTSRHFPPFIRLSCPFLSHRVLQGPFFLAATGGRPCPYAIN